MSTKWMQTDLLDEISPEGFSTIEEHMKRADNGAVMLADFYGNHTRPAKHGQIVNFVRYHELGAATLSITSKSEWTLSQPVPDGCNWIYMDNDWLEPEGRPTVQELVDCILDGDVYGEDLQELPVTFFRVEEAQRRVCCERGALVEIEPGASE